MSYATVAQFRAWFAGNSSRVDTFLRVDEQSQNVQLQMALDAGSARMDGGLSRCYVTPIDPTVAPTAQQAGIAALLALRNIWFACSELLPGLPSKAQFMLEAEVAGQNWLNSIIGVQGFLPDGTVGRLYSVSDIPGLVRLD